MKYNPYCKNLKTRIFDIETTGLYPKEDKIISASFVNPDGTDLVQFFCEAPQFEDILVEQIIEELKKCEAVITYNGAMFDLPFVLFRAKKHRVCSELPRFWSIDIYRWLKAYWPMAKRMPSLRQKAVEEALGFAEKRTDEIGGGECIELYNRYVNWNEEDAKQLILLHNGDDVRQLAKIAQAASFLPYHQICFEKGYYFDGVMLDGAKILKTKFKVHAQAAPGDLMADIYTDGYHLQYDSFSGEIDLEVPVGHIKNFSYVDLKLIDGAEEFFEDSPALHSGFLILADEANINYKECNQLSKFLISKLK